MLQTYGISLEHAEGETELCLGVGDDAIFGPIVALGMAGSAIASTVALPPLDLPLAEAFLARAPTQLQLLLAGECGKALSLWRYCTCQTHCAICERR